MATFAATLPFGTFADTGSRLCAICLLAFDLHLLKAKLLAMALLATKGTDFLTLPFMGILRPTRVSVACLVWWRWFLDESCIHLHRYLLIGLIKITLRIQIFRTLLKLIRYLCPQPIVVLVSVRAPP